MQASIQSLAGKLCIVTGSTTGIGKAAAKGIADLGAHVVLVARNPERAAATRREIIDATGNDQVDVLLADFNELAQVRALAAQILDRYPRIELLINNAGVLNFTRRESKDSYEQMFAVNHLAPFLLTNLLLDRIKASAPARIINVASSGHWRGTIQKNDLQSKRGLFRGLAAYGQSKLANVLFTRELARRLAGTGVTATCMHPGLVTTGLTRNNGIIFKIGMPLTRLAGFRSAEKGAETIVWLAHIPNVEDFAGEYLYDQRVIASSAESKDEEIARWLWQASEELTGLA